MGCLPESFIIFAQCCWEEITNSEAAAICFQVEMAFAFGGGHAGGGDLVRQQPLFFLVADPTNLEGAVGVTEVRSTFRR